MTARISISRVRTGIPKMDTPSWKMVYQEAGIDGSSWKDGTGDKSGSSGQSQTKEDHTYTKALLYFLGNREPKSVSEDRSVI